MMHETQDQNAGTEKPAEMFTGSIPSVKKEVVDPAMTFELRNEQGVDSEKGDSVFWVTLKSPDGKKVEGKFFGSGEGSEKLLVFEPGMPGDANTWMETRLVPELIRDGYSVFCVRHGGTKVNAENSGKYVHCPERIAKEAGGGNAVIGQIAGKTEYSLLDIDEEAGTAIEALQKNFKELFLVGHSSGAEGIAHSLPKLPKETTDKIRSFVSLAGYIGRYDPEKDLFDAKGIFNSEKMKAYYEYCRKFIAMGDPSENVELKKQVLQTIHQTSLPENINLVLVNSPKDEYVTPESAQEFSDSIGRGLRIIDETQTEATEAAKAEYHDLTNLKPETLLRLLRIYHPNSKHTATVRKETI